MLRGPRAAHLGLALPGLTGPARSATLSLFRTRRALRFRQGSDTIMGEKFIYATYRLTKTYGKREVLKDITLGFFPGAKIGVIGSNGAGKPTLLRVMAGEERDFNG